MTLPDPERSAQPDTADLLIDAELHTLGLSATVTRVGLEGPVHECRLHTPEEIVATGWGTGTASATAAKYEAFERERMRATRNENVVDIGPSAAVDLLRVGKEVAQLQILASTVSSRLRTFWSRFTEIQHGEHEIYVPTGLIDPTFPRILDDLLLKFRPIVTTTGIAAGANRADAILHGMNEVVERHLLMCLNSTAPANRPRFVPLASERCAEPWGQFFRHRFGVDVEFADLSIHPQHIFVCRFRSFTPACVGSGCSMRRSIAISRAVHELLLQAAELVGARQSFGCMPARRTTLASDDCAAAGRRQPSDSAFLPDETWDDASEPCKPTSQQVTELAAVWAGRGVDFYVHDLHSADSGVSCVSVLAPALTVSPV